MIEEHLPTQADISALVRSHSCMRPILQERLYSRTKRSEVDSNLRWSFERRDEDLASSMLSMGADILLSVDDPVPLSIAAIHGQLNMVKFLIKCDLTIINKSGPTDDKCTAIMGATIQGNTGIIKFLLTQPDLDPQKPSTYFSYFSYDRIHEVDLGKKLREYDKCKTRIDQALSDGNRELVQILLADTRVELSASSLTAATRGGHEDMIRPCLIQYPQEFDPEEESLLIIATRNNDTGLRALAAQLAIAVEYVHSQGFVHGDLHYGNVLLQLSFDLNSISVEKLYKEYGEPGLEAIRRFDGKPLPPGVPSHVVIPIWFGEASDHLKLPEAYILLANFGEVFSPAQQKKYQSHTLLINRAPEVRFEPHQPLSFPSDI